MVAAGRRGQAEQVALAEGALLQEIVALATRRVPPLGGRLVIQQNVSEVHLSMWGTGGQAERVIDAAAGLRVSWSLRERGSSVLAADGALGVERFELAVVLEAVLQLEHLNGEAQQLLAMLQRGHFDIRCAAGHLLLAGVTLG